VVKTNKRLYVRSSQVPENEPLKLMDTKFSGSSWNSLNIGIAGVAKICVSWSCLVRGWS